MFSAIDKTIARAISDELADMRVKLPQILEVPVTAQEWRGLIQESQQIVNDVVKARTDLNPKDEDQARSVGLVERRINGFQTKLKIATERLPAIERLKENFDISLIMATADRAMTYNDAKTINDMLGSQGPGKLM